MILNAIETLLVNNPVRGFIQRNYEGPLLRKLGGRLDGARVLEAGSGQGMGVRILLEQFGAEQVCAVDLDPRQVHRAKRKLTRYTGRQVVLAVASVEQLPFPDEFFDAVFDFGTLHHVPAWQAAVAEIRRVLKPAARFFFEEVTKSALNRWLYRALLDHPTGNRFSEAEFVDELAANGIALLGQPRRICANDIFVGVGQGHALQSRCPWACG